MDKIKKQRAAWVATLLFALVLLGGLVVVLWRTGFFAATGSPAEMRAYIQACTPYSHLMFFVVQLASVVLAPIPSNLTAAVGGMLFGTVWSFLITWAAVVLGSALVFGLSRMLGRSFAEKFISRKNFEKYHAVIRKKQTVFLALAFLFPFFPDDLLCIMAGLTEMPFRKFLLLCVLFRPWGLLVACGLGGSAFSIPLWGMIALGAVGAIVFLLALKYGDRVEEAVIEKLKR